MCGQNVGKGRGLMAEVGLFAMELFLDILGPDTVLQGMAGEAQKNGHISEEAILEIALRPGMFFGQGKELIEILRSTDPASSFPKFAGSPF